MLTNDLTLKYSCGCSFKQTTNGLRNIGLCKKHYKEIANFNAFHIKVPEHFKKLKTPRWSLIK